MRILHLRLINQAVEVISMLVRPTNSSTSQSTALANDREAAPLDTKEFTRPVSHVDRQLSPAVQSEISGALVRAEQILGRGKSAEIKILGKPMVLHRSNSTNSVVLQTKNDFAHFRRNGLVLSRNDHGGHTMLFNNRIVASQTTAPFSVAYRQLTSLRHVLGLMPSVIYA